MEDWSLSVLELDGSMRELQVTDCVQYFELFEVTSIDTHDEHRYEPVVRHFHEDARR